MCLQKGYTGSEYAGNKEKHLDDEINSYIYITFVLIFDVVDIFFSWFKKSYVGQDINIA